MDNIVSGMGGFLPVVKSVKREVSWKAVPATAGGQAALLFAVFLLARARAARVLLLAVVAFRNRGAFLEAWLVKWVERYARAWCSLPSKALATPKRAATDPALLCMVTGSGRVSDFNEARSWTRHHNLFMSAENRNGSLLEEYIADAARPYGWVWCRGQVLTAVDFCNHDCTLLFQVKNKTNTENSSSRGFREAHGAVVWNRLRAEKAGGRLVTYWPELVELLDTGSWEQRVPENLVSEAGYLSFVKYCAKANPALITDEEA